MAKGRVNKQWLHDHVNDPFVKLAQRDGYRARAAYKLKEIDEAENLIQPGQHIVDLGCAPGSWAQYVRRKLAQSTGGGIRGRIIGLDLLPMEPIADVDFIQGDFREQEVADQLAELLAGQKLDLVLSDMAPNLSGIAVADAARVEDIVELAIDFAGQHLKPSGSLLVKCFNGSGYQSILERFRQVFRVVSSKKPRASRDKSSELFLLGRGLRSAS